MVQVQYRRKLAGAPVLGKWHVYSAAWFNVSSTTPSAPVLAGLQNLFLGRTYVGTGTIWTGSNVFDLGAGQGLITIHEWVSASKVKVADHVVTLPSNISAGSTPMPAQCMVTVGYRSTTGTNTRLGRSRWFVGPLNLNSTCWVAAAAGGARLTTTGINAVKTNAVAALAGLEAAGWELQVSSRRPTTLHPEYVRVFSDALELYVDDVIDIQRSRRPWVVEQQRSAI